MLNDKQGKASILEVPYRVEIWQQMRFMFHGSWLFALSVVVTVVVVIICESGWQLAITNVDLVKHICGPKFKPVQRVDEFYGDLAFFSFRSNSKAKLTFFFAASFSFPKCKLNLDCDWETRSWFALPRCSPKYSIYINYRLAVGSGEASEWLSCFVGSRIENLEYTDRRQKIQ